MAKKTKNKSCGSTADNTCCSKVEALISVDERGQMVLPKEIREKAGIAPGDKLVLVSWEKDGKSCCISLIKAESFVDMVKDVMGPMMKDIMKK